MANRLFELAVTLLFCGSLQAGVVYHDLSSFLAATQPPRYLETFDGAPPTDALHIPPSLPFSGNGYGYAVSAVSGLYVGPWAGGSGQTIGPNWWGEDLTVAFTAGNVKAFGGYFFLTDVNGVTQDGTVTLNFSDGGSASANSASGSSLAFLGYTSDSPLSNVVLETGSSSYWIAMDDVYVGDTPTPEPAAASMLGGGLLLAAGLKRLRELRKK